MTPAELVERLRRTCRGRQAGLEAPLARSLGKVNNGPMASERRLRADAFVRHLSEEVPEAAALVDAHVEEYGELLLHPLVADLRRLLWERFHAGDADVVHRGLAVLEGALTAGDEAVANAVAVSFVEDIGLDDPAVQPFVDVWPQSLRDEADRQRAWEPDPYYVFVWDRKTDQLVASFAVGRASTHRGPVADVSDDMIPSEDEEAWLERLRLRYPLERYMFGGGYAPSLRACVEAFFGLEKDYDEL